MKKLLGILMIIVWAAMILVNHISIDGPTFVIGLVSAVWMWVSVDLIFRTK